MAMGTSKQRERLQALFLATSDVAKTPANAFYDQLNQLLDRHSFDRRVEHLCRRYYLPSRRGRPSLAPGV